MPRVDADDAQDSLAADDLAGAQIFDGALTFMGLVLIYIDR
jgi:hypothetical protein